MNDPIYGEFKISEVDVDCCHLCTHAEIDEEYKRELRFCEQHFIYFRRDMLFVCDHFDSK